MCSWSWLVCTLPVWCRNRIGPPSALPLVNQLFHELGDQGMGERRIEKHPTVPFPLKSVIRLGEKLLGLHRCLSFDTGCRIEIDGAAELVPDKFDQFKGSIPLITVHAVDIIVAIVIGFIIVLFISIR